MLDDPERELGNVLRQIRTVDTQLVVQVLMVARQLLNARLGKQTGALILQLHEGHLRKMRNEDVTTLT